MSIAMLGFSSAALLIFILGSLCMRLRTLTLIDAFLFSIAMFFGAYTLIDIALVDVGNRDALAVAIVFADIAIGATLLWGYGRIVNLKEVSLARLQQDFLACPSVLLILVTISGLIYLWYSTQLFSSYSVVSTNELDNLYLPYWFTSVGMVAGGAVFSVGIATCAKAIYGRGVRRLFWFAMSAANLFFLFGLGRRVVFGYLAVIAWMLISRQKRVMTALIIVLAIPVLIAVSNSYLVYRTFAYRGAPVLNMLDVGDLSELQRQTANIVQTTSNLIDREAIWRFNYDIIKADLDGNAKTQWGRLLLGEFGNYIPAIILGGKKQFFDSESELEHFSGLDKVDRGSNLFAFTYGDFWFLGFLIAPLMIISFVWLCTATLRRLEDPFLRLMLTGMALFPALNIEASYLDHLGVARSFVIIAIVYVAARCAFRFHLQLAKVATRKAILR